MTPYELRAQATECRDRIQLTASAAIRDTLSRCANHFDDMAARAEEVTGRRRNIVSRLLQRQRDQRARRTGA